MGSQGVKRRAEKLGCAPQGFGARLGPAELSDVRPCACQGAEGWIWSQSSAAEAVGRERRGEDGDGAGRTVCSALLPQVGLR